MVALGKPLVKAVFLHAHHLHDMLIPPTWLVVTLIGSLGFSPVGIAVHNLMLVKRSVLILLVYDINTSIEGVKVCIIIDEEVHLVTILASLFLNVAIGILHLNTPRLAIGINTTAGAALWVLNTEGVASKLQLRLLVVTGLLLCFSWIGVGLSLCGFQSFFECLGCL